MKRLHVHVSVTDLPASIRFYLTLFGADPAVTQADYEDSAVFNHGESTTRVEAAAAACCVPAQRAQPACSVAK
jgi:catechol 2,3-dioxygenase-like lactoylglutathione lyase family enzyme